MIKMKRFLLLLSLAFTLLLPGIVAATPWDLKADWSNTANPNGVWEYMQGTTRLPNVVWSGTQKAWAMTPTTVPAGHVPTWMQVTSFTTSQLQEYDIAVHPTSGSSSYSGEANVIWNSPLNGTIEITGNSWWGGYNETYNATDIRGVEWKLYFNDDLLSSGSLSTGTLNNRNNPMSFGTFTRVVDSDDDIRLEAVTMTGPDITNPWFIGVNLNIKEVQSQVPEPATMLLLGLGLVGLVGVRRKFKR